MRPVEQGADAQARGRARAEQAEQIAGGQPGVDDVLDQHHIASRNFDVEVFDQPHDTALRARASIARDRDEVDLYRDVDRPREIGQEVDRALQGRDEQRHPADIIARDGRGELAHCRRDLLRRQDDRRDVPGGVVHGATAVGSTPYLSSS